MATARADENYDFRDYLKHRTRLSSKELDQVVCEISARVWKNTDCTECGNCCRETVPAFTSKDVERLAGRLGMSRSQFESEYLKPADSAADSLPLMRQSPCPFLEGNRCSVYEHRPDNCRDYPYLDRPHFISRTLSIIGRLSECPAAFQVWEELKGVTGYRRRSR
jgi:uncharacterized protein